MKTKFLVIAALALGLSACSNNPAMDELESKDTNKAEAKVAAATAAPSVAPSASPEPSAEPEKSNDIWTYYDNATWSDEFEGLKTEIQKVVVSDKAPRTDDQSIFDASAVGVKFKLENTTNGMFTTYPDQATLVTSTGEQLDAEVFLSDNIGGEIEKGVIKEGNVIWYLERGHAEDITWIKLKWYALQGDGFGENDKRKEYAVEIPLK